MPSPTGASDAHRTKRSFQPSIDSFFLRSDSTSDSYQQQERDARRPSIPASIQSSLLNVGMRVRKSVPEGYKTHKTLASKQLDISNYISHDEYRGKENVDIEGEDDTPLRRAELTPFCGLHKVGGMAQPTSLSWRSQLAQPTDAHSLFGPADFNCVDADEDFPFASSQESNFSNGSTDSMPARRPGLTVLGGNSKAGKRGYHDYSDDEEADIPMMAMGRTMAKLRGRGRRGAESAAFSMQNVQFVRPDDDFEDADFLRPIEGEVEMGGV